MHTKCVHLNDHNDNDNPFGICLPRSRNNTSDFSVQQFNVFAVYVCYNNNGNDPSAGSPTETLLRLLLPLNVQVWASFQTQRCHYKSSCTGQSEDLTKTFNR